MTEGLVAFAVVAVYQRLGGQSTMTIAINLACNNVSISEIRWTVNYDRFNFARSVRSSISEIRWTVNYDTRGNTLQKQSKYIRD